MKTIFITGGHYTPAKAVIDELIKDGQWNIYYLGNKYSFEGDRAPSYEFLELETNKAVKFLNFTTGRLQRRFTMQTIPSLLKIPIGFCQSVFWIVKYRPGVILSFGGYSAVPIVIVGKILGREVVTHEQTTVFGLANRIIQKFSDAILVSFKSTIPEPSNSRWKYVGNPIRSEVLIAHYTPELLEIKKTKEKLKIPLIYVTGGKQGSHVINMAAFQNLEELLGDVMLIVQTGANEEYGDFQRLNEGISKLDQKFRDRVLIKKFVMSGEIGAVLELCDLVVSRAGANAVFDLAAVQKPAILVPIPWSSGNEQAKNALELASRGGAKILEQERLAEDLLPAIKSSLTQLKQLQNAAKGARSLVVPGSAAQICKIIIGSQKTPSSKLGDKCELIKTLAARLIKLSLRKPRTLSPGKFIDEL